MSAKTRGRNARNSLSAESPTTPNNASNSNTTTTKPATPGDSSSTPKDSTPTTQTKPVSIIRTRHQAAQDANPGVEIKRRPTPGIRALGQRYDKESSSPDGRTKSSAKKSESDGSDTPKRGRKKQTPVANTEESLDSPVAASGDKEATTPVQKTPEIVKRGRGRPKKSATNTPLRSVAKQKVPGTNDAIEISDEEEESSKVVVQKKLVEKPVASKMSPHVPSILRKSPSSKSAEASPSAVTRTVYSPKDLVKKASAIMADSSSGALKISNTSSPFKIVTLQEKPPVASSVSSSVQTTNSSDNGETLVDKQMSTSENDSTAPVDAVEQNASKNLEPEMEKTASSTPTSTASTDMLDILANACLSQSSSVSPSTEAASDSNSGKDSGHKASDEDPSATSEQILASSRDSTNKSDDKVMESASATTSESSVGQNLQEKSLGEKNKLQEEPLLISPEAAKPGTVSEVPTTAEMAITQALANQFQRPQMDVISAVNTSLEQEHENTWDLAKLINLFIQWQNSDAMCWLDVVLSILVHSPTLKDIARSWSKKREEEEKNGTESSLRLACESQDSMTGMEDTDSSQASQNKDSDLLDEVTGCLNSMLDDVLDKDACCDTSMAVDSETKAQEDVKDDNMKEDTKGDEMKDDVKSDEMKEDVKTDEMKEDTKGDEVKDDVKTDEMKEDIKGELKEDVKGGEMTEEVDSMKTPKDATFNRSMSTQSTPIKDPTSAKAKLKFPIIITLIKAHEQAQYLLQNFLAKPFDKPEKQGDKETSLDSISAKSQTGAGIKIISPLVTALNKQTDSGLPADALTHIGESIAKLEDVREVVWDILQPRLKCEKGKNDSPVFALPLLVRESQELKHIFSIDYSLVFHCTKCNYSQENKFVKALPSLPNVPDNFSMEEPAFVRNCFTCEAPGQRMAMKIHSMKDIAMLHFLRGLPRVVYDDLDFNFGEDRYSVTAVVQYKNNPDHFVSWIRNAQLNQWMECDDLKSPLCQFENAPPRIPPEQIHIVMWEKNVSNKTSPVLENSRTAGLLSTLLMSTRMVTLTSDGNSKILTTVPIQYTPVTPAPGAKRKAEDSTVVLPRAAPRLMVRTPKQSIIAVSKPAGSQSPTIHKNLQDVIKQVKLASESMNNPDQKAGKTKVVIMGTKKGNNLTPGKTSNDLKNVSIGGRIVKLTTQQLDAIRNSPGARVSIVGSEGTTTFSIKSVSNVPPTQQAKPVSDSPDAKTQTLLSKNQAQQVSGTAVNPPTPKQQQQESQEKQIAVSSVAASSGQQAPLEQQGTQTSSSSTTTAAGSVTTTSTSTQSSATQNASNKLLTANPNRPCRIVVNSLGHVTAIANNDNSQIIPLTNDKLVNRALLEKFFSNAGSQLEQNNILIEQDSTFKIAPNIRSSLSNKAQTKNSSKADAALGGSSPKIHVVSSTPKSQESTTTPKIQIKTTAASTTLQAMLSPQSSSSSLETAMAVDSITSPISAGRGSKVGARGRGSSVGSRGRGRGRGGSTSGKATNSLNSPLAGGYRKVAIPTNSGHILLEIPPGRTPIECLTDPTIVKKLVKSTSMSRLPSSVLAPKPTTSSSSQQSNSNPTIAPKPNTSIRTISVPSSQENKIKELLSKYSLGKMASKTVVVQRTKQSLLSESLQSNEKQSQSDVLSAALFESGVASVTPNSQGAEKFNQSSSINSQSLLNSGLETSSFDNSQGLDIFMQGSVNQTGFLNPGDTPSKNLQELDVLMQSGELQETATTQTEQESQAMSILTGGITPDIVQSGALPTSTPQNQLSLQNNTQQIQTGLRIGRIGATSSIGKPIIFSGQNQHTTSSTSPGKFPQGLTIKSNGDSLSNTNFVSVQEKILNTGSQTKKVIVKTMYPPSYLSGSMSEPQVITTVLNANKEVIINPQTISPSPTIIKRKATSQLADLITKRIKTSAQTAEKSERSAQDILSSIESGSLDQGPEMTNLRTIYFDPTDSNSQYIIGSSETVYDPSKLVTSPSDYLTTDVSNPVPSVSTDNNIFSKFGMTDMGESSQSSGFQTLYDNVASNESKIEISSSLPSATEGQSDLTGLSKINEASDSMDSRVLGDPTSTNGNILLPETVAQESGSLLADDGQNLNTSDGQQVFLGSDGQHYVIGADGEPILIGSADGQQIPMEASEDQQVSMPTDDQQIVMGDDGNQYMVGPDGQARQIFLGEDGQHYVMEASDQQIAMATEDQQPAQIEDGAQVMMGGDVADTGTDGVAVASDPGVGQPEGVQQAVLDADGQQIVLGPGEQQLVMGSDGYQYIVTMGEDGQQYLMETDPNQQYVMGTGPDGKQVVMTTGVDGQLASEVTDQQEEEASKPLNPGPESTQSLVLTEEVASVAENVEI